MVLKSIKRTQAREQKSSKLNRFYKNNTILCVEVLGDDYDLLF